jgi:peptidoglycan/LPS O-acetylase OafA/YrhL
LSTEYSPLLHTWSLSVEEQFYLFFPNVYLVFFGKHSKRLKNFIFTLLFFLSFCLSVFASNFAPTQNYYSTATRVWEILLGSLLAINIDKFSEIKVNRRIFTAIFLSSISIIMLVGLFFDSTTKVPGFPALLPTFATAWLILSSRLTPFSKILQSKYIVYVGVLSYEIYLWHQPIFSFWKLEIF